jgi:hypothetical protein
MNNTTHNFLTFFFFLSLFTSFSLYFFLSLLLYFFISLHSSIHLYTLPTQKKEDYLKDTQYGGVPKGVPNGKSKRASKVPKDPDSTKHNPRRWKKEKEK